MMKSSMSDAEVTAPQLRSALSQFATGVTIVTCRGRDGRRVGMTANSFNALSLAPPLLLWSLRLASPSAQDFRLASHFAVNVLTQEQVDLSRRFASAVVDKFSQGLWSEGLAGLPVLAASAAVFECAAESQQTAGDHLLFIGRVLRVTESLDAPLVFHGGRYHMLGEIL